MRFAAVLLSAVVLAASAHASTLDTFTLTATDTSGSPYSLAFSLDPTMNYIDDTYGDYEYSPVSVSTDGSTSDAHVFIGASGTLDDLAVNNGSYLLIFNIAASNGTLFLTGDPSTEDPTVTPGTYTGTNVCTSSLSTPQIGLRSLPTLAFFQMPTLNCDAAVTLTVTTLTATSTTVTPEPSTLALLGSGALGVFGIARRRFLS